MALINYLLISFQMEEGKEPPSCNPGPDEPVPTASASEQEVAQLLQPACTEESKLTSIVESIAWSLQDPKYLSPALIALGPQTAGCRPPRSRTAALIDSPYDMHKAEFVAAGVDNKSYCSGFSRHPDAVGGNSYSSGFAAADCNVPAATIDIAPSRASVHTVGENSPKKAQQRSKKQVVTDVDRLLPQQSAPQVCSTVQARSHTLRTTSDFLRSTVE